MKTKRTLAVLVMLSGLLLSREAQAFYSPSTGRWLSRDPVEEEDSLNVYVSCGNAPADFIDLLGLRWKVSRSGSPKASALPEAGDTVIELANLIGLNAAEYDKWLTASSGTSMPGSSSQAMTGCEQFEIPNRVVAYWAGWGKGIGKTYVQWNPSVKYLRARGFYVDQRNHKKGDKLALQKVFVSKSIAKELHGVYFWGHGYAPYPSTGLVSQSGDALIMYASPGLDYHLALGLIFACDSNSGRKALMSGNAAEIWHGFTGTLVPTPWMQYHAKHFIKPGQQETH